VAAELAICVALCSRHLCVAGSLRAEGDRDHPMSLAIVIEGECTLQRGHQSAQRVARFPIGTSRSAVLQRRLERVQHQLALVGEVVGEGPRRHAGLASDVSQCCGLDSGQSDEACCGVGELGATFVDIDHPRH
jgi:hypothetical protein